LAAALAACGVWALHGGLETWVQHVPAGPSIAALFREVPMPGGSVPIRRPPAEARPELTKLIGAAPRESMLYRLRAQAAETALDFGAAEADWKVYADNAADRYASGIELADFYHRRFQPRQELAVLAAAATAKDDPLVPAGAQRGWRAFERMAELAGEDALPASAAEPLFRAWVARYPSEPAAWRKRIEFLATHHQLVAAEAEISNFVRVFHDDLEAVRMRADLELRRGSPDAALALYDRAIQPLWPDEIWAVYFKLLEEQGRLRKFAGRARTALAANPAELDATARLFHYFRAQNNVPAARRVLLEYRIATESGGRAWTGEELETLAKLFESVPDVNEAARLYYALYSVPPAGGARAERALYGLANLLLTAPDQPIQFGSGDLSFYQDIATADPSPGLLNGILSLLLNSAEPRGEYREQNGKSTAYFHRAAAAGLLARLEREFPKSAYRARLHAALVAAYGAYGDDASVIRAGRDYLAAFGEGRVAVAMQIADSLARTRRGNEELALYDRTLRELGTAAAGVPIGSTGVRSGEYVQVLDKYLSRLAALKRPTDALRVYRTEIDRNPNDPGLYSRFAAYLEQNGVSRDVEDIYTKAIARFPDRSWYHKLARWYLRTKRASALEKISRDAIAAFSGTELEQYFAEVVTQVHPDAVLYRQLNVYAHRRFPEDLVFVHNLLDAYDRKETYDSAAADGLLRQYWFYDAGLRSDLFERLSAQGRLYPELAEIRSANPGIVNGRFDQALAANPAAVEFAAEAEAWLSHFEAAAPAARALAEAYPGAGEFTATASSLYRSLAAYYKEDTEIAVALAGDEQRANPRDPAILARMGDILADRELFGRASAFWERMPAAQPGKPEAYLDTATVYWDYYLYKDALRWIAAARKQFQDPALFAFQAGAIYEGRRDDRAAVREYLAGALHGEGNARGRLLRLLSRPGTGALVDRATADAIANVAAPEAVSLRIAVLEARQRRPELETLLEARAEAEQSPAALTELQETARRLGFDAIEERASERAAAIVNDPVDKMRLTLAYARLLESKKDVAGAARVADALYRGYPLILGVVRGVVDLHVRNREPGEAIDILLDAAKHARADLAARFTLESARIATAAGQFDRARGLLAGLVATDPLSAEYLAAMADTHLQARDDTGFRNYQLAAIGRLKQSPLSPADRTARIATLRRGLIPALDRLNDGAGAVDQYIEVVNAYPEDEALTREAASYAVAHGQAGRLVAFYRKNAAAAPLDYRWPIVAGRIETVAEDYPAAIADYERAIKARPDRADVLESKAGLEERLMRFDDAIASYGRLYDLSYRDPQWMIKVAELQARSGRSAEAVQALQTAIVGARTETADADFAIAERLETWRILPEAAAFADRGARLAAADLFQDSGWVAIYARIMARARRMEAVLSRLGVNPEIDQRVTREAGEIVGATYTPEEKARLEQALVAAGAGRPVPYRDATLLPVAQAAGLADLEARWRHQFMAAGRQQVDQSYVTLQSQRGLFADLGRQLEQYAAAHRGQPVEGNALAQAARAYFAAGDVESQMRMMRMALAQNALPGDSLARYLGLLAERQPGELLAIVRGNGSSDVRNRAVQAAIAASRPELAYAALRARGGALPLAWTRAYTALAGVYFGDRSAAIDTAFQAALDTRTIGERLKTPLKTDSIIAGSVWFYYGARYGDYLASGGKAGAEAWLPAYLEAAPLNPDAYMALGDAYARAGQGALATAQFEHALELDSDRGDAHDQIARVLWSQGRQVEAIARWRRALAAFLAIQSRGVRVPEPFWGRVAGTFTDIGGAGALGELHGDIANLLGDYYQRNATYRLDELIEAAARACISSGQGTEWLVELGRSMDNPEAIVDALMRAPGVSAPQRISLQRERVAIRVKQVESAAGDNRREAETMLAQARWQLTSMLLDAGDVAGASAAWSQIRSDHTGTLDRSVEIRLASRAGGLGALLERYRLNPDRAPSLGSLQGAAMALRSEGDENGARSVLEFLYGREIRGGHLDAANFLGLAEVKLQQNQAAEALALLNRMALVAGGAADGFDTLPAAAGLLGKYGKTADAAEFIGRRVKAVPWDAEARLQLARILAGGSPERERLLTATVGDAQAAYGLRAEAARLLAPHAAASGSELALLSSPGFAPEAAAKPYWVEARMDAARSAAGAEAKLRLWREALAIAPADDRVRLGALRAALALGRDSLAMTLADDAGSASVLGRLPLTGEERAAIAEALAAAAERLDDLAAARRYLQAAIDLRPPGQRQVPIGKMAALIAEQERRAANAARQPAIKDTIEQGRVVRPFIPRSAQ
jgi:Tfp pilus assembly protein PilF